MSILEELLSEETQQAIQAQIKHLDSLSQHDDDPQERIRFDWMVRGAKTVLNIISNDASINKGTTGYLQRLSEDQLAHAINEAKRVMKRKKDKGFVVMYGVFGSYGNVFWSVHESLARKAFVDHANKELDNHYPEVKFEKRKVPIDELGDYLDGESNAQALMEYFPEFICFHDN